MECIINELCNLKVLQCVIAGKGKESNLISWSVQNRERTRWLKETERADQKETHTLSKRRIIWAFLSVENFRNLPVLPLSFMKCVRDIAHTSIHIHCTLLTLTCYCELVPSPGEPASKSPHLLVWFSRVLLQITWKSRELLTSYWTLNWDSASVETRSVSESLNQLSKTIQTTFKL